MGASIQGKTDHRECLQLLPQRNLKQTQRLQYSRQYTLKVLASMPSTKSAAKPNLQEVYSNFISRLSLFQKLCETVKSVLLILTGFHIFMFKLVFDASYRRSKSL